MSDIDISAPIVGTHRREAAGRTFDVVTLDVSPPAYRAMRATDARDLARALIDAADLVDRRNAERKEDANGGH